MSFFTPSVEKLERRRDIAALVRCLREVDSSVRKGAADALGRLGEGATLEPLICSLWDSSREVRQAAAGALSRVDPDWRSSRAAQVCAPKLISALQSHDEGLRLEAAEALTQMPVQCADGHLADLLLHDGKRGVRIACAHALGAVGDRRAVTALITAASKDADMDVRAAAVAALGEIADQRAVVPIVQIVQTGHLHPHDQLLLVCVRALSRCRGIPELIELLKHDSVGVGFRFSAELKRVTGESFDDWTGWDAWWKENCNTFRPDSPGRAGKKSEVLSIVPPSCVEGFFRTTICRY
jgi:HEAT repeat protein